MCSLAVHQAGQDLVEVVHLLLVERQKVVNVLGRKPRLLGLGDTEELGFIPGMSFM